MNGYMRKDKNIYDQEKNKVTDLRGFPLSSPSGVLEVFPLKIILKNKEKNYSHIDF